MPFMSSLDVFLAPPNKILSFLIVHAANMATGVFLLAIPEIPIEALDKS